MPAQPSRASPSPTSAVGLLPRSVPPMIVTPTAASVSAAHRRPVGRSRPVTTAAAASRSGVAVTRVTEAATVVSASDQTQAPKCTA